MKRTQRIDAIRNIRRNRVSFLSIIIISMLAVTAYLGLDFSAAGVRLSANATYEAENYADIEIDATAAFTKADLDAVRAAEGVADAEGIVAIPSRIQSKTAPVDITIRSVPERISLPHVTEGRLPETGDECAVEKSLAEKMGYGIGRRVELSARKPMSDMVIGNREYTVTGIFTTAEHLTDMVSYEPVLLVTRDAFNRNLLPLDRSTRILVQAAPEHMNRFSTEGKDRTDRVKKTLEETDGRWIVTALHNTTGYLVTDGNTGILDKVSLTFSMLFVVIAALVIYSTIGRLVAHESRLVGAEKALGLKNGEIFAKYLLFGAGGAFAGAVAGILIAYFVFERIILFFFGIVFILPEQVPAFRPVPTIIVTAGTVLLAFAAVFLACRRLMKSTAVSLMNGTDSASMKGKRKRSSRGGALYIRLMLRNMRTDWKRVLVSIVSIGGCCTLLMLGFSLRFSVSRLPERQYGDIQRFETEIALDTTAHPEATDRVRAVLEKEDLPFAAVYSEDIIYRAGDEPGAVTLVCPDDGADLSGYYHFTDAENGRELAVPETGILVTVGFAEEYGLGAGDSFLLYDSGMNAHSAEIAGVFENYTGIWAVCGKTYAEECLGEKKTANTLLLLRTPEDPEALREKLSGIDGFVSIDSARKQEALFDGMSGMMNLVILLLGLLAVMIACFILLNLVSTYVNQKKNELTIMRINGYTTGETIRYASMECYGITLLGILLGLAAGQAFGGFVIRLVGLLSMRFVKEPVWMTFAASAGITALISGAIHFFAFRKIRDLKLSDIQK